MYKSSMYTGTADEVSENVECVSCNGLTKLIEALKEKYMC